MTQAIAICNQKGGVSKTTTCQTLGACLAEAGYPSLLIDLDPQANLSIACGVSEDNEKESITDLIQSVKANQTPNFQSAIHHTSFPNLDLISADTGLAIAERELFGYPGYEMILKGIISAYQEQYAYVLIDCLPSLGGLTIMALSAAQRVIIPVQCDYLSAWGVMRLIETIDAVHDHTNPDLVYHLLIAMYDQRNNISRELFNRFHERFGAHMFETVINLDTRLRESVVSGEPVIAFAPRTRASQQYRALAREIIQNLPIETQV